MIDLINEISSCSLCKAEKRISDFIILKKPESFIGSISPSVMLIGHSPSVRNNENATVVLKLDKEDRPLFKYISNCILKPLQITKSSLYATNLIKCQTTKLPEDISKEIRFFDVCFAHCKNLFEKGVETVKPKLIISLSETVLEMLSSNYMGKKLKMKDSFGSLFKIHINGKMYDYIPVVHIPKGKNSRVFQYYFPEQTQRLMEIRSSLVI